MTSHQHLSPTITTIAAHGLAALVFLSLAVATAPARATPPTPDSTTEANSDEEAPPVPFRLHSAFRAPSSLILHGSHHTRYEHLGNQFRPGLDASDQLLALRTLLTVGGAFGPVRIVGELQDSRGYLTDENSAVSSSIVNAMELLQAYVNLRLDDVFSPGSTLELRAGRQTMDVGSKRLVGRNGFRNAIQSYTGVTGRWQSEGGTEVVALGVLPVRAEPSNGEPDRLRRNAVDFDRESFDLALWGGFLHQPLGGGVSMEAYVFGLHERDGEDFATRDRQLYTPGLRLLRSPQRGEWDFDVESVVQLGTRRASTNEADRSDHDVLAHLHHISGGYTFNGAAAVRVGAELDYASGDDGSTPDRVERFDPLFGPRRGPFGPTDIYGPIGAENLVSTGIRVGAKPHARVDGFISWRANWLARSEDAFARTGIRDASGQSGNFAGHQIELRSRVWIIPDSIRWEVGGAAFIRGEFMRDAPNATGFGNPLFAYTDLQLLF